MLAKSGYEQPSLRALSNLLRDRGNWPEGFHWDFHSCPSCALGLTHAKWRNGEQPQLDNGWDGYIGPILGITKEQAYTLFMCRPQVQATFADAYITIQPEHIADVIDKFLATEDAVAEALV